MSEQRLTSIFTTSIAAFAAATFFACSSGATTTSDPSSTEEQLAATQSSLEEARARAEACFATFRTCESGGGDEEACRAALQSCLPPRPPPPARCGGPRPPPGDAAPPPPPPPPPDAAPPPERPCDDGGRPPEGRGERPRHGHGGHRCGPPPVAPEAMKACGDALRACVSGGGDRETCMTAHQACVKEAFAQHFAEVCQRVATNCDGQSTDACARMAQTCKDGVAP